MHISIYLYSRAFSPPPSSSSSIQYVFISHTQYSMTLPTIHQGHGQSYLPIISCFWTTIIKIGTEKRESKRIDISLGSFSLSFLGKKREERGVSLFYFLVKERADGLLIHGPRIRRGRCIKFRKQPLHHYHTPRENIHEEEEVEKS